MARAGRFETFMTFVVTESCIRCKYTDCVDVCPTDAFREGSNFLAIDPDDCIDCRLCVPECPVSAIFDERDIPLAQRPFIDVNRQLAKTWRMIARGKAPLPDADYWANVEDKARFLDRT